MNFMSRPPALAELLPSDETLMDEIAHWLPVLRRLGIHGPLMGSIARRARANGTTFKSELIYDGLVSETTLYKALAAEAGLEFLPDIDPDLVVARDADCLVELKRGDLRVLARLSGEAGAATLLVAPQERDLARFLSVGFYTEQTRRRVCVMTPTALRAALTSRASHELKRRATNGLFEDTPQYSAKLTLSGWQAFFVGATSVAVPLLAWYNPILAFVALHLVGISFFFCCSAMRFLAARNRVESPRFSSLDQTQERPVYSVLVALYHEADVVPRLLVALSRLQWPRHLLQIKLVCEADDTETIEAITAHQLRTFVEIVRVPACLPRTKPKALRYALPLTSGEFVALYDAEDQPHPLQLEEAWQHFLKRGDNIACVQAPLDITNGDRATLSGLFAFEYAALFHGLLPWLAGVSRFLPLGGTSNHFRRSALDEVGGWDPHNVAEDADLGVRLARFGYACETITLPTREQGPEDFVTWRPQRSRWFKGRLQLC